MINSALHGTCFLVRIFKYTILKDQRVLVLLQSLYNLLFFINFAIFLLLYISPVVRRYRDK